MSHNTGTGNARGVQETQLEWLHIVGPIGVCLVIGVALGQVFGAPFTGAASGFAAGVGVVGVFVLRSKSGGLYWRVATANPSEPSQVPRNHVICIDGTAMFQQKGGNVYRLFKQVKDDCKRDHRGVGVKDNKGVALNVRKVEHGGTLVGGATGHGATALLRQACWRAPRNS